LIQQGSAKLSSVPSGGGGGGGSAATAGGATAAAEEAPAEEEKEEEKEESDEDVIAAIVKWLILRWVSACSIRMLEFVPMLWVSHNNESLHDSWSHALVFAVFAHLFLPNLLDSPVRLGDPHR